MKVRLMEATLLAVLVVSAVHAQEMRSVIFGRVTDSQDSAVAGATVVVTNADTNRAMTLISNDTGYYEANLLVAGNYRVTAEMAGFKKSIRSGIILPVSTRSEIDIRLEIGEIAQSVLVTSEAPMLDTSGVSPGRVMENRSVTDLPTFNNAPLLLVKLTPGIQSTGVRRYNGVVALGFANDAMISGNVGGNQWSVDGLPITGSLYTAAFLPYSTTIQEFKVETANFDASVGHTSGATVSVMTKAGTNSPHVTLTEQHWQQRLNATPFFVKQQYYRNIALAEAAGDKAQADRLRNSPSQPSGHSNNYAATVGGPVVLPKIYNGKNKLFFTFSFDGFEDRKTTATTFNHTVPTMRQREGDFSDLLPVSTVRYQLYDPLSVRPDPVRSGHFVRDPIPGNIIQKSRIVNPAYKTYLDFLPTPNNPPARANLEPLINYLGVNEPYNWSYKALMNRFDYQPSEKNRFYGRWSWVKYREDALDWTYEKARGLMSYGWNRNVRGIAADWTHIRSSSTVVDVNVGLNDFEESLGLAGGLDSSFKPSDVGLPAYMDAKAGNNHALPVMSFAGYDPLGQLVPGFTHYDIFAAKTSFFHIRGSHTLRGGIEVIQHMRNGGVPGLTSGSFGFANDFTSREDDSFTPAGSLGHSWAAFMMGLPTSSTVETNATYALANPYSGWYVQDAWRASSKLTLNFGLRIEYEWGRQERYNRVIGYFDPNAALPITDLAQAAYAKNPVPGLAPLAVKGGSVYPGQNGLSRRLQAGELMWLPRFSAAYQIRNNTVLRAGYGLYYDTLNAQNQAPDQSGFSRATINPITTDFGLNWLSGDPRKGISPLTDPFPVRGDGTRFDTPVGSLLGLMAKAGSGWTFLPYDLPRPRQQRWRLDVQRQIGANMMVSAAYVGSYSNHVKVTQKLDSLPAQYWATGLARNDAVASDLNQNVPNPFYIGNFSSLQTSNPVIYQSLASQAFFKSPTIRKNQLLRPFSQMNGLNQSSTPAGEVKTHSLEATFQQRWSNGFTINANYTALRERDRDFYFNEFDPLPGWRLTRNGVPNRFAVTGIFELPFGKTKPLARSGIWNALLGGFQLAAAYEVQQGHLLDWGNLFYYGDIGNINTGAQTLDRWFNVDGFERAPNKQPAAFQARVFPQRIDGLRANGLNRIDCNIQREFKLTESVSLQLRLDALNLANRSQFSPPIVDPTSTNFGKVTNNTATTMRWFLLQARINF